MGDRSNIVVENSFGLGIGSVEAKAKRVWLYSHWSGQSGILSALTGLRSGRAQHDASYLARIIFSRMVKDSIDSETGYGISTTLGDNEHPIIVISVASDDTYVWFEDETGEQLSQPLTREQFETIVKQIIPLDAAMLAARGELYEKLIEMITTQRPELSQNDVKLV